MRYLALLVVFSCSGASAEAISLNCKDDWRGWLWYHPSSERAEIQSELTYIDYKLDLNLDSDMTGKARLSMIVKGEVIEGIELDCESIKNNEYEMIERQEGLNQTRHSN